MKKKLLFITLIQVSLFLGACGDKKQEAPAPSDTTEEKATSNTSEENAAQVTEDEDASATDSEIANIKKFWQVKSFEVEPGDITPGIQEFALAFCKQYPKFISNKTLSEYLISPKEYNEEKTGYHIDDQTKNGYISSSSMAQYTTASRFCYWKRNDGHRLLAVWLEEEHENESGQHLIAFYDYDVANDVMKPEPALTELVENAMSDFDDYAVVLPVEGKNIELNGYTYSDDSAETTTYQMIWDGQTFKIKK